ncbi:MAG: (2Fe-2S)-binding protein [Gemmatimonadota bacterium]
MIQFTLNGRPASVDVPADTPLLWVLRDTIGARGTRFGCGIGQCGACTVHLDGEAVRSCSVAIAAVAGKAVTTIEGLSPDGGHPLQRAWLAEQVAQCGYCQTGQIMQAAALLARVPRPTDADIDAAMSGNLCRCGTYARIRRAIHRAAGEVVLTANAGAAP